MKIKDHAIYSSFLDRLKSRTGEPESSSNEVPYREVPIRVVRGRGRPRKAPEERQHPCRKEDKRYSKKMGRVLPRYRKKRHAGSKHWAVRKKYDRDAKKRQRMNPDSYTSRRDLFEERSVEGKFRALRRYIRMIGRRKGLKPEEVWLLTLSEWCLLWSLAGEVTYKGKQMPAFEARRFDKDSVRLQRLDTKKPYQLDNLRVVYQGRILWQN